LDSSGLLAAIAGVVVPVYLWRADLNAHSLRFRIVSQTPLQPKEIAANAGLKISVDGQELKSPSVSVVEITNDGARPIPSANFEGPLELNLDGDVRVLRVAVTSTSPTDIRAQFQFDAKSVKLQPLLLNPRDSLTLALITDGSIPTFQPRARISGITGVAVEDATKPAASRTRSLSLLVTSFAFFLAAWILGEGVFHRHGILLSRRGATFASALLAASGIMLIVWSAESIGGGNAALAFILASSLNLMAMLVALLLGWTKKAPPPAAQNEA
jgi:hypothetical protein